MMINLSSRRFIFVGGTGKRTMMSKRKVQFQDYFGSSSPHHRVYSVMNSFRSSFSNFVMDQVGWRERQQKYYSNNNKRGVKKEEHYYSYSHGRRRHAVATSISYREFFSTTTSNKSNNNNNNNNETITIIRDHAREHYIKSKLKYEKGKATAKIRCEAVKVVVKQKYEEGKEEVPKLAKRGAKSSYQMLKQYGPVFVGTYATIYMITLGGFYGGIDTGFIDPVTMISYLKTTSTSVEGEIMEECRTTAQVVIDYLNHYAWSQPIVPFLEKNPHFANLAVAWVATKVTEPLRFIVCFAAVPKLADYLGFVPTIEDEDDEKEEGN